MALTLDATVGGASSNAYATVAEADSYHDARLHKSDWTSASTATKEAAIVWATEILDRAMEWEGWAAEVTQKLRWPRTGTWDREGNSYLATELPEPLKNATAELARLLIASDRYADADTAGFKRLKVGDIELDIDKADRIDEIPLSVREMLSHIGTKQAKSMVDLVRA